MLYIYCEKSRAQSYISTINFGERTQTRTCALTAECFADGETCSKRTWYAMAGQSVQAHQLQQNKYSTFKTNKMYCIVYMCTSTFCIRMVNNTPSNHCSAYTYWIHYCLILFLLSFGVCWYAAENQLTLVHMQYSQCLVYELIMFTK